jgi:hypothetical protein
MIESGEPADLARRARASTPEAVVPESVSVRSRSSRSQPSISGSGAGNPGRLWGTVEWCEHRIEGIPVPAADGRWRLIVVEGEATWS